MDPSLDRWRLGRLGENDRSSLPRDRVWSVRPTGSAHLGRSRRPHVGQPRAQYPRDLGSRRRIRTRRRGCLHRSGRWSRPPIPRRPPRYWKPETSPPIPEGRVRRAGSTPRAWRGLRVSPGKEVGTRSKGTRAWRALLGWRRRPSAKPTAPGPGSTGHRLSQERTLALSARDAQLWNFASQLVGDMLLATKTWHGMGGVACDPIRA